MKIWSPSPLSLSLDSTLDSTCFCMVQNEDNGNISSICCFYLFQKLHMKVLAKDRPNRQPLGTPFVYKIHLRILGRISPSSFF